MVVLLIVLLIDLRYRAEGGGSMAPLCFVAFLVHYIDIGFCQGATSYCRGISVPSLTYCPGSAVPTRFPGAFSPTRSPTALAVREPGHGNDGPPPRREQAFPGDGIDAARLRHGSDQRSRRARRGRRGRLRGEHGDSYGDSRGNTTLYSGVSLGYIRRGACVCCLF